MKVIRTDRSRVETAQRCMRQRWLEYHEAGMGIVSAKKPLPLAVGGSVHEGLAKLLQEGQALYDRVTAAGHTPWDPLQTHDNYHEMWIDLLEQHAVDAALADFAQHRGTLALDTTEMAQQATSVPVADDVMRRQLADSLGLSVDDAGLAPLMQQAGDGARAFDDYLWAEQSALVEALVRAYSRRRLRPLLEQYEVLEVEREGEWLLSEWRSGNSDIHYAADDRRLMFMSRPDALLRDRTDNSLYILSFKTAASWDVRKARDAQHDMQGLSEGVEVERRLGAWHSRIMDVGESVVSWRELEKGGCGRATFEYLCNLSAPPRILGIRYEYMLKGDRWKDKDLSQRVGFDARVQKSHLIRQYGAHSVPKSRGEAAYSHGDVCWSWEWLKPDGTESKLAWQNWSSRPVWDQPGGVKGWIDALDASAMQMSQYDSTVGMEPREMGWAGPAQALGTTKDHPLDSIFIPPIIVYRQDDDLRDWIEQTEEQEREIAEHVAELNACSDADGRRSLLNRYFRQTRRACSYPTECQFVPICYGGQDIRSAPLESGRYVARTPNHPMELLGIKPVEK